MIINFHEVVPIIFEFLANFHTGKSAALLLKLNKKFYVALVKNL